MADFLNTLLYHKNQLLMFQSVLFILLFSVFYLLYALAFKNIKTRNILLMLFSLYFYYKLGGIAIVVLLFIATSDFFIGKWMFKSAKRKIKSLLLLLAIFIDLGLLLYFKYTNFFLQTWAGFSGSNDPLILNIIAPIGISYFVFKKLTDIFGIYREDSDIT